MSRIGDAIRAQTGDRAMRRIEVTIERKLRLVPKPQETRRSHHRLRLPELPDNIRYASCDQEVECRIPGVVRLSRAACYRRQTCRIVVPGANDISFWCKGIKNDPDNEINPMKFMECRGDPKRGIPPCPEYLTKPEVMLLVKHLNQGFRFKSMGKR